jgi:hypothetical protein
MAGTSENDTGSAPKRRTRTVSTLTREQLRRKRDLDRQAQRALRERTRSRIQVLEDELAALQSARSQRESLLSKEIRDLQEANEGLRQRLGLVHRITGQLSQSNVEENGSMVWDHDGDGMMQAEGDVGAETNEASSVSGMCSAIGSVQFLSIRPGLT